MQTPRSAIFIVRANIVYTMNVILYNYPPSSVWVTCVYANKIDSAYILSWQLAVLAVSVLQHNDDYYSPTGVS